MGLTYALRASKDADNLRTLKRLALGLFRALRFIAVHKGRQRNRPYLSKG